ncbi:MAG: hypothetical protein ACFFG0_42050 [Candidatus Thorarchaeota archaeon]
MKYMFTLFSDSSLQNFFTEIYHILREADSKVNEIWCEISKISFFQGLGKTDMYEFLESFEFISIKKGNYIQYIAIDKILFIINCIKFLRYDIVHLSEILDYSGFEKLIKEILSRNYYQATTNFRFSWNSKLKSTISQKRFEIDVIGIYLKYILIIDAKQWRRKDSYSSLNKAAILQYNRIRALKNNPEALLKLIKSILGKEHNIKRHLPLILIPVMVTLEDNSIKLNENQIPLVSIYKFNAFLQELPKNLHYFKSIQINKLVQQRQLNRFSY